MALVFLGLGSNQGDRLHYLEEAKEYLNNYVGTVIATSPVYETEPWGYESKSFFLNRVISVKTSLSAEQIINEISKIEEKMGRNRSSGKYADRIIDIDLLLYDDLIISTDRISVPHPQMDQRKFVLQPVSDIAGETVHPVFNKTINQLLAECNDQSKVELYPDQNSSNN
jgi:2-amino-4-hydroxy-6-hydroxymethyldihydropteridine diphosphokinase